MLAAPSLPWGAAERERLDNEGFVLLPHAISAEGLRDLNSAVDEHLALGAQPLVSAPWRSPGAVGDLLWQLANEPSIVALARELCGAHVMLWAGGLTLKTCARPSQMATTWRRAACTSTGCAT